MKNKEINHLLHIKKITKEEYELLFQIKEDWSVVTHKNELIKFEKLLHKIISLQKNCKTIDLSFVHFYHFTFRNFNLNTEQNINFYKANFWNVADFYEAKFEGDVTFHRATFHHEAYFRNSSFLKDIDFGRTIFNGESNFSNVTFYSKAYFGRSTVNTMIDFTDAKIKEINLTNTIFKQSNYVRLVGIDKQSFNTTLKKTHFANKESVRHIKAHFEQQNNISEANKYFALEQEKYLEELSDKDSLEPNKIATLTTLYLNKFVSNFGTDWIRALLFLFMLTYLFMRFYIDFDKYLGIDEHIKHFTNPEDIRYIWAMLCSWGLLYLSTYFKTNKLLFWILVSLGIGISLISISQYDNFREMSNYIIQLTNPINAFKNMNLYEGIELYGAIVRITIVTIIYQLIVAFRQNTRRK